tara:strand:- start:456 stop:803 length:348 start_codon:yes stop_codon:yes gene_type:complete
MKQHFFDIAVEEAERSVQRFKHGAVIVKGGKIVSTGFNKVSRKCPSHMFSVHAEVSAIKHSKVGLCESHVYVVRLNTSGLAESKPCENCQKFMKMHGVSRCFYSNSNGRYESLYI